MNGSGAGAQRIGQLSRCLSRQICAGQNRENGRANGSANDRDRKRGYPLHKCLNAEYGKKLRRIFRNDSGMEMTSNSGRAAGLNQAVGESADACDVNLK